MQNYTEHGGSRFVYRTARNHIKDCNRHIHNCEELKSRKAVPRHPQCTTVPYALMCCETSCQLEVNKKGRQVLHSKCGNSSLTNSGTTYQSHLQRSRIQEVWDLSLSQWCCWRRVFGDVTQPFKQFKNNSPTNTASHSRRIDSWGATLWRKGLALLVFEI